MIQKIEKLSAQKWAEILAFREDVRERALSSGPADTDTFCRWLA